MVWGSARLAAEKLWIIATAERTPRGTSPGRPGPPVIEKKSGPPDVLMRNRPKRLTGSTVVCQCLRSACGPSACSIGPGNTRLRLRAR